MLSENKSTLKIHTLLTNQIGFPILKAEFKFNEINLTAKILLDSGSEVTVMKNKYLTRNKLQKGLVSTKLITIKGINSDPSISKK
jgi:hypothetical protein